MTWEEMTSSYGSNTERGDLNARYIGAALSSLATTHAFGPDGVLLDIGTDMGMEREAYLVHTRVNLFADAGYDYRSTDIRPGVAMESWDACSKWPYAKGEVAGVIMCHVIEHMARPWKAFKEAYRVLRPDGLLHIRAPFNNELHYGPVDAPVMDDYWRPTPEGLKIWLVDAGFDPDKIGLSSTGKVFEELPADWPDTKRRLFPVEVIAEARR